MVFELREVFPEEECEAVFDLDVLGFRVHWWNQMRPLTDTFSVFKNGQEVARIAVIPQYVLNPDSYIALNICGPVVNVNFFEVRADQRRRGIGQAAVGLLVDHYHGRDCIAFSLEADEFWSGVGWTYARRVDGDSAFSPLFVSLWN